MNSVIILLIFVMCWLLTLAVSFTAGFLLALSSKRTVKKKAPTSEISPAEKELQEEEERERENFVSYRGVPQLGHKDYR